ncbi:type II toxin-antitoxin system RelE/ParE family toxin [Singulisphaera sp. GP187]|uniref:type II toxin-antitoxin system RelE/ParE family toxin n=1 Tax=Singulisphaera sp. GP187 TaxID=1882752 RepID=UPI0009F8EBC7
MPYEEVSLEVALRFYDAAAETFTFLARNSGVGVLRKSKNPAHTEIRVWRVSGFNKHLIFYRPFDGGVEIVRVIHGHRDLDSELGPENG